MKQSTRSQQPVEQPPHWISEDWPGYLGPAVATPRTAFVVVAALAIGFAFDLAVRSGVIGVAGALTITAAAVLLATSGRLRNAHSYALAGLAPLFAMWLAIRMSPWLLPLDLLAACGLVVLAASLARGGSVWDLTFKGVVSRGLQAAVQAMFAPGFLLRPPSGSTRRPGVRGALRGVLIALPVVVILSALLASADVVFASFIRFDASELILHVVLITIGALAMAAVLRLSSIERVDVPRLPRTQLGVAEWTVVLVSLNVVLGAFAIARVVALTEGGHRVIRTAGLTYAEYARSGFFQLIGAALLAIVTLLLLRSVAEVPTPATRARFVGLALGVIALTLAMVISAFHRVLLYESVFGLSMLRLYAQVAIVWIGVVLFLLGIRVAGIGSKRAWLVGASVLSGLVLLFALNVMDPEAFVARYNISHKHQQAPFDVPYLSELSEDAVPALAEHPEMRSYVCSSNRDGPRGWAAFNLARERAQDVRARLCRKGG